MIDYTELFDQNIKTFRLSMMPHASKLTNNSQQEIYELFRFGNNDFHKARNVCEEAQSLSYAVFGRILGQLFQEYKPSVEWPFPTTTETEWMRFKYKDTDTSTLLLFVDKTPPNDSDLISGLLKEYKCNSYKCIYILYDYTEMKWFDPKSTGEKHRAESNEYTLKDFFEEYFGIEEYKRFDTAAADYVSKMNDLLGYVTLKTLVPGALSSFQMQVEKAIVSYPYENLKSINQIWKNNTYTLCESEFSKLRKRFFEDKWYYLLLGTKDFSESIITAEWLYDSMKEAQAIDLTVIGLGYCKAVEQLLYRLINLRASNCIKPEANLGNMAHAVMNNINASTKSNSGNQCFFRSDLDSSTMEYVSQTIFAYKNVRNNHFHRDNIRNVGTIDMIRDKTYQLLFLLLCTFDISNKDLRKLGMPQFIQTDFEKLCEYVNFHRGEQFTIDFGEGEQIWRAKTDEYIAFGANGRLQYSGVYFSKGGEKRKFTIGNLPRVGYVVNQKIGRRDLENEPIKKMIIYENGKYVGPPYIWE